MRKLRQYVRDLLLALVIGLGIGAGLCLLAWIAGAVTGGSLQSGASAARSAILLVGGVTLLFAAILLIKGGNLPEDAFHFRAKREEIPEEHPPAPLQLYRAVPRPYTALLTGIGILLVSVLPDLFLLLTA